MTSLLGAVSNALIKARTNEPPVPYTTDATQRGGWWRSGATVDKKHLLDQMGSVSTLFSVVNLHAGSVAQVEWHLYRKARSGVKEDRTEVFDHQALRLWNQANDWVTGMEMREAGQQHCELVGEIWIIVEKAMSIPLGLWVVRPDRMEVVTSAKKYVAGYIYTGPAGEKVPLDVDEVLRIKQPHPTDPHRGMGAVQSLLTTLDSVKYSEEWNRNFFLNSAAPGGIIEVPDGLQDHEFRQLKQRWNQQHQGVSRAHKVAILEYGKWVDRSFSQADMQFAELRNVSRDIILEAFRTHKHMMGITDDVNRANAEAADYTHSKRSTVPRLLRWKSMANGPYLALFGTTGQGLEFDYENPVPEDDETDNAKRNSQTSSYKTLVDAGVNPEDAAKVVGLPAMNYVGPPVKQGTGGNNAPAVNA